MGVRALILFSLGVCAGMMLAGQSKQAPAPKASFKREAKVQARDKDFKRCGMDEAVLREDGKVEVKWKCATGHFFTVQNLVY